MPEKFITTGKIKNL